MKKTVSKAATKAPPERTALLELLAQLTSLEAQLKTSTVSYCRAELLVAIERLSQIVESRP